jgi:CRISPR-associated protein Csx14
MSPSTAKPRVAYIATLGKKPQVFTYGLDRLIRQLDVTVVAAAAVHLASPPKSGLATSRDAVALEVRNYYKPGLQFYSVPVRHGLRGSVLEPRASAGRGIESVEDLNAPDAIWLTFHQLIHAFQADGMQIHLCLTGGPRLLGLQALSAASLLMGSNDACWTVSVPESHRLQAEKESWLHAPPTLRDDVQLVRVPTLPIGTLFPYLQAAAAQRPDEIYADGARRIDAQERARCKQVLRGLSARARDVLRAFARGTDSVSAVARELGIAVATVNAYKTRIYDECRAAWGLDRRQPRHHSFLRERFGKLVESGQLDQLD